MNRVVRTPVPIRFRWKFTPNGFSTASGNQNGVENEKYDVAIIGGGMVGMALACSLASTRMTRHLDIAIVDGNPRITRPDPVEDDGPPGPRVSAVTPATISLFRDIGAWKYVEECRHTYFDRMQVWDYTGMAYTKYDANDAGKDVLGCIVENALLHNSLVKCLQEKGANTTFHHARLTGMRTRAGGRSLQLTDGKTLHARLVVGGDGAKSRVRELAGIPTSGWSYDQVAVTCTFEHPSSIPTACTWQCFLPSGPIAVLPLPNPFCNLVWFMSPEEASSISSLPDADFASAANRSFDRRPPLLARSFEPPPEVSRVVSPRLAFPLSRMHAEKYVSERVALVGDAAHVVHPHAGQGVNLGFGDVLSLTSAVADAVAAGSDIGGPLTLGRFETERKPANAAMMAVLDAFHRAYRVDSGPFNVLRAAAFHCAECLPRLKRNIILYASGERKLPLFF